MNPIIQKLKSRRGASILIALLLFLVCAFVGGAVLVSAYQNASRPAALRQEQQNYLAVSSAAQLLKDELVGQSVRLQDITLTTSTADEAGNLVSSTERSQQLAASYTGILLPLSQDALAIFKGNSPSGGHQLSLTLDDHPELSGVQGTLTMSGEDASRYAVTALLRDADGGNELKLTFFVSTNVRSSESSSSDPDTGEDYTQQTEETTVTWTGSSVRLTSIPEYEEGTP